MRLGTLNNKKDQKGFTLLEMLVACVILTIATVGVLCVVSFAIARSVGFGDQATRSTEYAQDKMEQLMALEFADTISDVTVYPTDTSGSMGCPNGLKIGPGSAPSIDPANPTPCYVDYADRSGTFSTSSANAVYERQWMVQGNTTIKTITVRVTPLKGFIAPSSVLVSQKQSN